MRFKNISKNPLEHVSIPRQQKELISEENEADERNYWKKDEIKQFLRSNEINNIFVTKM